MLEHRPLAVRSPLAPTARSLREGTLSLSHYVSEALDRIEEHDRRLRAMLPEPHRRERLIAESRALTELAPGGAARGPLFGVLVAVKDIIAVDGFPMRAGSALPPEAFDLREGQAVRRLRDAGALILGKAVTTEFAHFDPGSTANPHAPSHTPGGSSSGSAVAVAAGYALLALGTQTVGSVIRPAAFCGVVGFKPSYGRVPMDGVLPYAPSVDTLGWFTHDVAGARLAAGVLLDEWAAPDPAHGSPVIGVPEGPYLEQASPEGRSAFEASLEQLADAGVEIRRVPAFDDIEEINRRHRWLTTAEFRDSHAERFPRYGPLYRGASAQLFDDAATISDEQRLNGLNGRAELRERLEGLMAEHGLDAWAAPAAVGPAPAGLRSTGDPIMNLPWTHAGFPVLTLPAAAVGGLPVGLQLAARAGADEALLSITEPLERLLSG